MLLSYDERVVITYNFYVGTYHKCVGTLFRRQLTYWSLFLLLPTSILLQGTLYTPLDGEDEGNALGRVEQ